MAGTTGTTTTTTTSRTLTMKLLVDSSPLRRRVVFAEAGKDTVDFLFSLLALPAGAAVRLLGRDSMAGCTGNLYSSAEKLEDPYVQQPGAATKDAVLCAAMPAPAAAGPNSWLLRLPEPAPAPAPAPKKLFNCHYSTNCRYYFTEVRGTGCPYCGNQMNIEAKSVGSPEPPPAASQEAARRGFVQGGMATYTVTDDLVVSPMSNVSNIALLNACAVRDLGALQERTVQIGYKEGLEILRAALQSKTVLTDVFLGKKPPSPMKIGGAPALSNGRRHKSLTWRA